MYITTKTIHFTPGELITTEREKYIGKKEPLQTVFKGEKLFVNSEPVAVFRDKNNEKEDHRITEFSYCQEDKINFLKLQNLLFQLKMARLKRLYLPYQVMAPEKHFTEKFLTIGQLSTIPIFYTVVDIRENNEGCWYTCMNKSPVIVTPRNEFGALITPSDQELLKKLEMRRK